MSYIFGRQPELPLHSNPGLLPQKHETLHDTHFSIGLIVIAPMVSNRHVANYKILFCINNKNMIWFLIAVAAYNRNNWQGWSTDERTSHIGFTEEVAEQYHRMDEYKQA